MLRLGWGSEDFVTFSSADGILDAVFQRNQKTLYKRTRKIKIKRMPHPIANPMATLSFTCTVKKGTFQTSITKINADATDCP